MAAIINSRDATLQAATPRLQTVNLPTSINHTGSLNGVLVQDVIDAAFAPSGGTDNFFTTSASDPVGGGDGDAHYNSTTGVMWFKIAGVWTRGGTVNASQITTGTLAAARIAANTITAGMLNVSTLSAITANLGTVTAGNISGTSNIDITGQASFKGVVTSGGATYSGVFNETQGSSGGILGYAGLVGFGVRGTATGMGTSSIGVSGSNSTGDGVRGTATSGVGVRAVATTGVGLRVEGSMQITSTALVTNLNADMVDGKQASNLCSLVVPETGSCNVSGNGFVLISNVTSQQVRGDNANGLIIETVSDERLKQDIEPEELGLEFIKKLLPKTFRMRSKPEIKMHGFVSQDVELLIDSLDDALCRKNDDGMYSTDYISLIAPLVKAVQELSRQLEEVKNVKEA